VGQDGILPAVANRRRPIDNRPQLNKLPYICIKRNSMNVFEIKGRYAADLPP